MKHKVEKIRGKMKSNPSDLINIKIQSYKNIIKEHRRKLHTYFINKIRNVSHTVKIKA